MSSHSTARPTAREVMTRGTLLLHIFLKAAATPPPQMLARLNQPPGNPEALKLDEKMRALFAQKHEKLRATGLWESLEEEEKAFLNAGIFETTMRQRVDASWLAESMECLLWAVGIRELIPPYDQQADPKASRKSEGREADKQAAHPELRPQFEIDRQRDWAELWHWRSRTHTLLREKRIPDALPDGTPMSRIIALSAAKAAGDGAFAAPIDDDFPAFGKPFRAVNEEEFSILTSIVKERHKAFNWLCGYAPGNRWSETPTDT